MTSTFPLRASVRTTFQACVAIGALTFLPPSSQATQNYSIGAGEHYPYFTLTGSDSLTLLPSGTLSYIYTYNDSRAFIGGEVSHVNLYGSSRGTVLGTSDIGHISVHDHAQLRIVGGTISFINLRGESVTDMYAFSLNGGYFMAPPLIVNGGAVIFESTAHATLHVRSLSYENGQAVGEWGDGTPLSFWLIEHVANDTPDEHYVLPTTWPSNFTITMVPEPTSLRLMAVGSLMLLVSTTVGRVVGKKRNVNRGLLPWRQ